VTGDVPSDEPTSALWYELMIQFQCPNPECRTRLEVGEELAGKKVRYTKCKTFFAEQKSSGTFVLFGEGFQARRSAGEQA